MTKQELINTYDSMSMPEEHVEAIEARLKKLYDNSSPSSAPEVPEESTREYKFDRKKPSAVKAAVISISAAAEIEITAAFTADGFFLSNLYSLVDSSGTSGAEEGEELS